MVYLGLSQDETLKNYRLLGHGKGLYPPRVESFAQSDIFLPFHLKWLFLKDPPPLCHHIAVRMSESRAGGKYSICRRRKSC